MTRQTIEQRIEELAGRRAVLLHEQPDVIEDQIDFLQSLLDEPEQQPLDAPTHSGLWWVEGVEIPVEYRHDTKTVREFESGYVQYLKDFQKTYPGKWLPANNPFKQ